MRARTFLNLFFTYHSTCPLVILPPFAHTIFAWNERSQFMSPASFSRHPSPSSFLLDRNSTEKSACRAFLNYRFAQLSSISELNGNKKEGEGEERKDSRRSLTEIHCFVGLLPWSRRHRIEPRLTARTIFANIRERKRKKKRTKERGGKKNSRERRSKGRSLTWMKFVFHPAASSSLSKGACSSMFLDATRLSWYIYMHA